LGSTLSEDIDKEEVQTPEIDKNEIQILEKIGGGCFGTVYKGICRGKQVAVKKLHTQNLDSDVMEEFRKEVKIMTHLRHPNVVLFMGACTEPNHLAIVTELLPRGNLSDILHSNIEISLLQKLKWAKDVAQGMNWLHCSKPPIIHRDLKPSNLLVDENWTVKVCDFGLSAVKRTEKLQDNGVAPGTPLWMSPEVLRGQPLNEKSDVYSFGIVLWEIITRKEPFEHHDSYNTFVRAICDAKERPPIPDDCPEPIRKLMEASWHENPDKRPSFAQIIEILDDAMIQCSLEGDPEAQALWATHFKGKDSVEFPKFAKVLYAHLKLPPPNPKDISFKCLSAILPQKNKRDGKEIVTLERFGLFLKWFGPLKGKPNIFDNMQAIMKNHWFHGDVDRVQSETLLNDQKPGVFLIRASTTEPEKTPFTISKVGKDGKISHQRINIQKDRSGFYLYLKSSKGTQKKVEISGPLPNLIAKVSKDLNLKVACPGSKFKGIFETVREIGGYMEQPDE